MLFAMTDVLTFPNGRVISHFTLHVQKAQRKDFINRLGSPFFEKTSVEVMEVDKSLPELETSISVLAHIREQTQRQSISITKVFNSLCRNYMSS